MAPIFSCQFIFLPYFYSLHHVFSSCLKVATRFYLFSCFLQISCCNCSIPNFESIEMILYLWKDLQVDSNAFLNFKAAIAILEHPGQYFAFIIMISKITCYFNSCFMEVLSQCLPLVHVHIDFSKRYTILELNNLIPWFFVWTVFFFPIVKSFGQKSLNKCLQLFSSCYLSWKNTSILC